MENSLLTIIPTAAVVGAAASIITTVYRESVVQRREDERLRLGLEWRLKETKLERLLQARKSLPSLGFPSKLEADGSPVLDLEALTNITQDFIRFTELEVKPLLSQNQRTKVEEPQHSVESWLNAIAQAFHGKAGQPEVPSEKLQELYNNVISSIADAIDDIEADVRKLSVPSAGKQDK